MSLINDIQKCPFCGFEQQAKDVVSDMETVLAMAEKMDYGEPEVQCSNCLEWFALQCKTEIHNC